MQCLRRAAFTLVELLVVLALISILILLLLPAINAAREAARRTQCTNNMKQIGLAVSGFEGARRQYPPGAIWTGGKAHGSALVHLLPFIEQKHVFQAFDFTQPSIDSSRWPGSTELVASRTITTYLCPSDDHDGTLNGRALHNYAASTGPTGLYENPDCYCDGSQWSAYVQSPPDNSDDFAGPFTRTGVAVTQRRIVDGLSRTIFFGEVRPRCSQHNSAGWGTTNNGNGYCSTIIPINFDTCNENAADPCNRPCTWNTEVGFKSNHPAGVNMLFGDGHVEFLAENVDHQLYQHLGAKADRR